MPEELEIQTRVTGVDEVKSQLSQVAQAQEAVGTSGEKSLDNVKDAANKTSQAMDKIGDSAEESGNQTEEALKEEEAMLQEVMDDLFNLDEDYKRKSKNVVQNIQKEKSAQEEANEKTRKHRDDVASLDGIYNKLKSGVLNWIAGYAGFQTVITMVEKYIQHLEKVRETMKKLSDEAQGTTGGIHQLAVQLGDVSEAGFKRAQMISGRIGEAGGFDLNTANQFAISMDVALGKRGGIKANMGVATEIAAVAGALNLQADEAGKLVELLDTAKTLDSVEKTKEAIAKLRAAFTASRSTSFGAFAGMMQRGGTGMLLEGMDLDTVLKYAVQTRQVSANEELAATVMDQFTRAALGATGESDKLLKSMAAKKGLDFVGMTMGQKTSFLQNLFLEAKTPQEQEILKAAIPAEIYSSLKKAFSEETVQATTGAVSAVAGAKSDDIDKLTRDFQATEYFQERSSQIRRQVGESSSVTTPEKMLNRMLKDAESEYDIQTKNGETSWRVSKEAWTEMRVLQKMQMEIYQKILQAQMAGDLNAMSQLTASADIVNARSAWTPIYGFSDSSMRERSGAYERAQTVIIHNTYAGTTINHNGEPRRTQTSDIGVGQNGNKSL